MSESDWTFYEHKWTRYRRQAALTGQNLLDELWACLDGEIERLAFQAEIASTDASDLMKQTKALEGRRIIHKQSPRRPFTSIFCALRSATTALYKQLW